MTTRKKGDHALCRTQPQRVQAVFAPLDKLLAQVWATGEVDISGNEAIIRTDTDEATLEAAVNGIIEHIRIYESRRGRDFHAPKITHLVACINIGEAFNESQFDAARREIAAMRSMCGRITLGEAREIAGIVEARCNAGAELYARVSPKKNHIENPSCKII